MPGSPQATPGEAESGGPQELLQPPRILDDPQDGKGGEEKGLADRQMEEVACRGPEWGQRYHSICLPPPRKGPKLRQQATEQERNSGRGGAWRGHRADAEVLVTCGPCT